MHMDTGDKLGFKNRKHPGHPKVPDRTQGHRFTSLYLTPQATEVDQDISYHFPGCKPLISNVRHIFCPHVAVITSKRIQEVKEGQGRPIPVQDRTDHRAEHLTHHIATANVNTVHSTQGPSSPPPLHRLSQRSYHKEVIEEEDLPLMQP